MRSILCSLALLALSGCACKVPPAHHWNVAANVEHIPMQGLAGIPRMVADYDPIVLVNFADEAVRDGRREADMASGALQGAAHMGVGMIRLAPVCVLFPPLCVGLIGVGAAVGASGSTVTDLPQEDANHLAAIVVSQATNEKLETLASATPGLSGGTSDAPVVVLRVAGVLLVPTKEGVTFRVVATAKGIHAVGQEWRPSVHMTQLPSRPVGEWLDSDGLILRKDLDAALQVLADDIVPVYLPYEERTPRWRSGSS